MSAVAGMTKEDPQGFKEKALSFDFYPEDSWHGEVELVDGTILDRDSYPVKGADGEYYGRVWNFHDITERKVAEQDLRTSRLQLAEAAAMAKIVHWEHEEATDEFILNDAFYALYGTTAELEGGYRMSREEHFGRFVHPDDRAELMRQTEENRDHPPIDHLDQYEHRAIRRDNGEMIYILNRTRVLMDAEKGVFKVVGVNQDITAQKKMEDALREGDNRLKLALASSRMGVWEQNLATDELFWSPECDELFGSTDFDGTLQSFAKLLHPEDTPRAAAIAGQISIDRPTARMEFRIIRPDGEIRWFASMGQGYFDGSGALRRMVGTVHDITEQKQTEEAVRRSETLSQPL